MLMLKLKKIGKKHQTTFRLIVDEKRHKLVGKNTEDLGWYNPHSKKLELNTERINYWLKIGAKPTDTVHNLLVNAGIVRGKKISVHKSRRPDKEVVGTLTEASGQPQTPAAEVKPAESAAG